MGPRNRLSDKPQPRRTPIDNGWYTDFTSHLEVESSLNLYLEGQTCVPGIHMKRNHPRLTLRALSFEVGALAIIAVIIVAAAFSLAYRPLAPNISQATTPSQPSGESGQLPVMNQQPTSREIWIQWTKGQSGQDRFSANYIIVNQGDTVKLTFTNNDTVIHNFVIGAPYSIDVNASVPGLYNDLTGAEVTGPATNNSPGVVVTGSPGDVTARYSFVAQYAGIYEFVCTYHVNIGMFGYLVVLPNAAYQP